MQTRRLEHIHEPGERVERIPPADEQRLLVLGRKQVVEKLDAMDETKVEAGNNEFLGICDGVELGDAISDGAELDNAEGRDDRSVEKRRWKT